MLEKLEKSRKQISIVFMIIINCVLIGSLLYISVLTVPEYKKQQVCHEYFLDLREKAGLPNIAEIKSNLSQTEEIIKLGNYFILAKVTDPMYFDYRKMCVSLCDDNETE